MDPGFECEWFPQYSVEEQLDSATSKRNKTLWDNTIWKAGDALYSVIQYMQLSVQVHYWMA